MSVFSIQLEACDPARNRFRAYQLDVVRDLFGAWLVEVRFGRIGASGRTLRFTLDDEPAARRMVRERLQRRSRAPGRIGVAYRTLELWDPLGWTLSKARHEHGQGTTCADHERRTPQRMIVPIPAALPVPARRSRNGETCRQK